MELTGKMDSPMTPGPLWDVLAAAQASYRSEVSPHYDEVFWEVADRVKQTGCLGKADIVVWKRLSARTPWASKLMSLPDREVRVITTNAVQTVRDAGVSRTQAAREG